MSHDPSKNKVMLGLIQMSCVEDPAKNLEKAVSQIESLGKTGAQIACLQELFGSRYFCQTNDRRFFGLAETVPGPTTDVLSKIAREKNMVIVVSLFEREGESYYNTACVIDSDGTFLGKYRKIHIPDDLKNHYSEMYYFTPGNLGLPVFKTRQATIGVLVCWDQWYPEAARTLAKAGAEIIFYPTAIGWPLLQREEEIGQAEFNAWVTIQRSHAIANGVFVASVNRTGREDHLSFWGGSFVADPLGRVLQQSPHDREENLVVSCDLNRIREVREDWPFLDCRRTDVYS